MNLYKLCLLPQQDLTLTRETNLYCVSFAVKVSQRKCLAYYTPCIKALYATLLKQHESLSQFFGST